MVNEPRISIPTGNNGYQVRIYHDGTHSKFFPFSKYVSEYAALNAAKRYRDKQLKIWGFNPAYRKHISTGNTSVMGVSETRSYDKRRGTFYNRFGVSFSLGGRKYNRTVNYPRSKDSGA